MNDNGAWTERRDELLERVVQQGQARKLRRRFVGAASVVLVAAVVAFGVANATSSPKRSVEVLNPSGRRRPCRRMRTGGPTACSSSATR
jgi:hypothetical protein